MIKLITSLITSCYELQRINYGETPVNKTAVALAADSAVTITNPKGQKIYNSMNKLFTLSKYHPVGVMIYGNGHLMGS